MTAGPSVLLFFAGISWEAFEWTPASPFGPGGEGFTHLGHVQSAVADLDLKSSGVRSEHSGWKGTEQTRHLITSVVTGKRHPMRPQMVELIFN